MPNESLNESGHVPGFIWGFTKTPGQAGYGSNPDSSGIHEFVFADSLGFISPSRYIVSAGQHWFDHESPNESSMNFIHISEFAAEGKREWWLHEYVVHAHHLAHRVVWKGINGFRFTHHKIDSATTNGGAMRLFTYEHPSTFQDEAVYRYGDSVVEFYTAALCPDCRSPVVWVEENEQGESYAAEVYHDRTCIQVVMGKGKVAPSRVEQERRMRRHV